MQLGRFSLISACLLSAGIPAAAYTHVHAKPGTSKPLIKHVVRTKAAVKLQTPRGIEDDRAVQLQTALIHAGYLTGDPSGHWDSTTEAAMQKLQADNGWQTKLVPDSRAIIKLGLGPNADHSFASSSQPVSDDANRPVLTAPSPAVPGPVASRLSDLE